jgi:hypothetical protein
MFLQREVTFIWDFLDSCFLHSGSTLVQGTSNQGSPSSKGLNLYISHIHATRIEVHFTNTYNFKWLKKTHMMPCGPCKLHTLAIKMVNSYMIKIVAQSFQHNSN